MREKGLLLGLILAVTGVACSAQNQKFPLLAKVNLDVNERAVTGEFHTALGTDTDCYSNQERTNGEVTGMNTKCVNAGHKIDRENYVSIFIVDPNRQTETLFTEWAGWDGLPQAFFDKCQPASNRKLPECTTSPARIHKGKLEIAYTDAKGKARVFTVHRAGYFYPKPCLSESLGCGEVYPK